MKKIVIALLAAAAVAAGVWWIQQRLEHVRQLEAEQAAKALAAQGGTPEERRLALFGPAAQAADIQWRPSGFGCRIEREGDGRKPVVGERVKINYTGRLADGTVFDQSKAPVVFPLNGLIPGMTAGIQLLGTGGKGTFFIPPNLGYGGRRAGMIPPNSGLIFEVELVAVNP